MNAGKNSIIDDGVDYTHPDYDSIGLCDTCAFIKGNAYSKGVYTGLAGVGPNLGVHGTPVSGFIGATNNNKIGIASIAGRWDSVNNGILTGIHVHGISMYILQNLRPLQKSITVILKERSD